MLRIESLPGLGITSGLRTSEPAITRLRSDASHGERAKASHKSQASPAIAWHRTKREGLCFGQTDGRTDGHV
jgi:hypothetical protein